MHSEAEAATLCLLLECAYGRRSPVRLVPSHTPAAHPSTLSPPAGRIGGDSMVAPRGQAYALRLAAFMNKLYPPGQSELVVWTSTLRRTMMTAAPLGREIVTWKALDEIDAGESNTLVCGLLPSSRALDSQLLPAFRSRAHPECTVCTPTQKCRHLRRHDI